ncbi:MAG: NAD(P)-dependent oxidoreductase [Nanoarchaeota archaeon]
MRILVTGSDGFISKNLIPKLSGEIIEFTKKHNIDDVNITPDIVIHTAAEMYDICNMYKSNIYLTYKLLEKSVQWKVKKFIYIGSSSEYGRVKTPINEQMKINPCTIYEATKGCATLLTQSFSRYFNLPALIIRPFTLYGPYEKSCKFLPTIFKNIYKKEIVKLVEEPVHDWVYIDDFIDSIIKLLDIGQYNGDIVNIGTGKQYSNLELIKILETILDIEIKYKKIDNMRSYDSNNWVCDITYAKEKYKIETKTDIKTGLTRYSKWIKQNINNI